jgi:hypothetical protein
MHQRTIVALMAAYYISTGAWPIIHMQSFEAVTGPKKERWLVRMVGALAVVNGVVLAIGVRRSPLSLETRALAVLSAAAFASVDIVSVPAAGIRPVYLADAAIELALAAGVFVGR